MTAMASLARALGLALLCLLATGCATTIPPDAGRNPADPWEVYNRRMFEFNERVDRAVTKPIAQAYTSVLPEAVRDCIGNAFNNFNDAPNALFNLLQGKPAEAASDICRVAINSTVGLLGCFDVASRMGLQRSDEDLGQALGRWGSGPGPYFVWPLLGPSSVRDAFGRVGSWYADPVGYLRPIALRNSMVGLRLVDTRALLLPAEKLLEAAALDKYQFIRDAYLQRRQNQVYDGNPPRRKEDLEDDEDDAPPAGGSPPPGEAAPAPPSQVPDPPPADKRDAPPAAGSSGSAADVADGEPQACNRGRAGDAQSDAAAG
jgi:phospholipid-binding lipoprotein MlaA